MNWVEDHTIVILILLSAVMQVLWVFLIRIFPDLIGGTLLKGVEHKNSVKLENIKNELSKNTQKEIEVLKSEYNYLKSSVDYLSANHSELRSKMINATEEIWSNILFLKKQFGDIIFVETVFLPKELDDAFANRNHQKIIISLSEYRIEGYVLEKLKDKTVDSSMKHRIFVGDRLWKIYFSFNAIILRTALLINWSFKEMKHKDWRQDSVIKQHIENALGKDVRNG